MTNKDIYERAIEKYGKEHQLDRCVEELLELATVLMQVKRKDRIVGKQPVAEEIADVYISLTTVCKILDISETDVWAMKLKKKEKLEGYLND